MICQRYLTLLFAVSTASYGRASAHAVPQIREIEMGLQDAREVPTDKTTSYIDEETTSMEEWGSGTTVTEEFWQTQSTVGGVVATQANEVESTPQTTTEEPGLHTGIIVVISVFSFLLILLIVMVFLIRRNSGRSNTERSRLASNDSRDAPEYGNLCKPDRESRRRNNYEVVQMCTFGKNNEDEEVENTEKAKERQSQSSGFVSDNSQDGRDANGSSPNSDDSPEATDKVSTSSETDIPTSIKDKVKLEVVYSQVRKSSRKPKIEDDIDKNSSPVLFFIHDPVEDNKSNKSENATTDDDASQNSNDYHNEILGAELQRDSTLLRRESEATIQDDNIPTAPIENLIAPEKALITLTKPTTKPPLTPNAVKIKSFLHSGNASSQEDLYDMPPDSMTPHTSQPMFPLVSTAVEAYAAVEYSQKWTSPTRSQFHLNPSDVNSYETVEFTDNKPNIAPKPSVTAQPGPLTTGFSIYARAEDTQRYETIEFGENSLRVGTEEIKPQKKAQTKPKRNTSPVTTGGSVETGNSSGTEAQNTVAENGSRDQAEESAYDHLVLGVNVLGDPGGSRRGSETASNLRAPQDTMTKKRTSLIEEIKLTVGRDSALHNNNNNRRKSNTLNGNEENLAPPGTYEQITLSTGASGSTESLTSDSLPPPPDDTYDHIKRTSVFSSKGSFTESLPPPPESPYDHINSSDMVLPGQVRESSPQTTEDMYDHIRDSQNLLSDEVFKFETSPSKLSSTDNVDPTDPYDHIGGIPQNATSVTSMGTLQSNLSPRGSITTMDEGLYDHLTALKTTPKRISTGAVQEAKAKLFQQGLESNLNALLGNKKEDYDHISIQSPSGVITAGGDATDGYAHLKTDGNPQLNTAKILENGEYDHINNTSKEVPGLGAVDGYSHLNTIPVFPPNQVGLNHDNYYEYADSNSGDPTESAEDIYSYDNDVIPTPMQDKNGALQIALSSELKSKLKQPQDEKQVLQPNTTQKKDNVNKKKKNSDDNKAPAQNGKRSQHTAVKNALKPPTDLKPLTAKTMPSIPTTKSPASTTKPPLPTNKPPMPTTKPPMPKTKPPSKSKPLVPSNAPPTPPNKTTKPTTKPPLPTTKPPKPTTKLPTPIDKPSTPKPPTPTTKPPTPKNKPLIAPNKPVIPKVKPVITQPKPVLSSA